MLGLCVFELQYTLRIVFLSEYGVNFRIFPGEFWFEVYFADIRNSYTC